MQISRLKKAMIGDGERLPESAKALAKWLCRRSEMKEASDKTPLEGARKTSGEKTSEEKRSTKFYEVLITMVTVPLMVGVVFWTASQLAGLLEFGDERIEHGRSSAFVSSPQMLQTGDLRQENLQRDGMAAMFLPNSGRHLLNVEGPSNYPKVSPAVLDAALAYGKDVVGRSARLEMNLESAEVRVGEGSAEHGQLIASYPKKEALRRHGNALVVAKASLHITHTMCQRLGFKDENCAKFVATVDLGGTDLGKHCDWHKGGEVGLATSPYLTCSRNSPYRTADGSCNNPKNPSLGKAYTGYRRLIFPKYADGVQQIRRSVRGKPLPSARLLSTFMATDGDRPDSTTTLSLMQWTQFVEHDMAHTPSAMMLSTGTSIMCCRDNGFALSPRYLHPACAPVEIPSDDPFYSKHHQHCMNYVRSITTIRPGCTLGPAEQINQATHFLDASMIYGQDLETQRLVRSFTGGKLKTTKQEIETSAGKRIVEFFPQAAESFDICQLKSTKGHHCYHGGDSRANEDPQMTVMHTLWLREHNRLADMLAKLNSHWDDERLFQEARRILIAELQHVTYSEWLPNVIGKNYYDSLFPKSTKFSSDFNNYIDPSTSNEFASAAIRFALSMMDSNIRLYNENRHVNDTIHLRNHYNQPLVVEEPGHFDSLVRGLATQNSQQVDLLFTRDVTSLLWRENKPYGMDIVSLDIQRGRDHGLQPYNQYRELCGLPLAKDFEDLLDVMTKQVVDKLRKLYANVDDIDLYVGGMSELPYKGIKVKSNSMEEERDDKPSRSLVGPTFRCIIGEQMLRTRHADNLFYDKVQKDGKPGFTQSQIAQLMNVSLARIFCDNSNEIHSMQRDVFQSPSINNPLYSCDDFSRIPTLDLTHWKE